MEDRFETPWPGIETGGTVALNLANTLDWRLRSQPAELLHAYPDLLRWAWSAGALNRDAADSLRAWAAIHGRAAARALKRATDLREAIAAVFQAKVRGEALPASALATIESVHEAATRARSLRTLGASVGWAWRNEAPEPDRASWAAALDAVRLLTSDDLERVSQCADAACGWFFIDVSRNRSRRWCSMRSCGNRNKVRSFYRRSATRT